MKIEIWSDVMCPFCYIGKRKFEDALTRFAHSDQISVEWKSFQLNPELKTNPSIKISEYLAEAKGWSLEKAKEANEMVGKMAAEVGLIFDFDKMVVANSYKAHQFIQYAKTQGKDNQVEEYLFEAYFKNGKNIDDIQVLNQIANRAGFSEQSLDKIFEDETYEDAVKKDIFESRQIGVRGVPFFLFDEKYAISGAQPASVFLQILEQTFSEWEKTQPIQSMSIEGMSCDVDGNC